MERCLYYHDPSAISRFMPALMHRSLLPFPQLSTSHIRLISRARSTLQSVGCRDVFHTEQSVTRWWSNDSFHSPILCVPTDVRMLTTTEIEMCLTARFSFCIAVGSRGAEITVALGSLSWLSPVGGSSITVVHEDLCLSPLDNPHLDLLKTETLDQHLTTCFTLFLGMFVEVNPRSTPVHAADTEDCVFLHEPQKTRSVLSPLPVLTRGL